MHRIRSGQLLAADAASDHGQKNSLNDLKSLKEVSSINDSDVTSVNIMTPLRQSRNLVSAFDLGLHKTKQA